jgi:hypothetical protein
VSFTDGKPFVVTEEDIRGFGAGRPFACERCRGEFVVGETARWQYMPQALNITVCTACDTEDLIESWTHFWKVVSWYGARHFADYPTKPRGCLTNARLALLDA